MKLKARITGRELFYGIKKNIIVDNDVFSFIKKLIKIFLLNLFLVYSGSHMWPLFQLDKPC